MGGMMDEGGSLLDILLDLTPDMSPETDPIPEGDSPTLTPMWQLVQDFSLREAFRDPPYMGPSAPLRALQALATQQQRQQQTRAAKPRLDLTQVDLFKALDRVRRDRERAGSAPAAQGWKKMVVGYLDVLDWRSVKARLPGWGLTDADLIAFLKERPPWI